MGKRLFATKASTLNDKIITVNYEGRYNSSVYEDIKEKHKKASQLHDLQLAVETFAKNLGMTYTKAVADGGKVAQLTLKSKLKQFYNSWREKVDGGIKEEYLFCFYQGTRDNSSEKDSDIIKSQKEGGLSAYFEGNLNGETLEIVEQNVTTAEKQGKILQTYVEETAKEWRKEKQKFKKGAKENLKKLIKVCKTVKKYEDWFMNCGSDD